MRISRISVTSIVSTMGDDDFEDMRNKRTDRERARVGFSAVVVMFELLPEEVREEITKTKYHNEYR